MAVRRRAFVEVGGFDETLTTCEDVDLCNRLRRAGWELLSDSRLYSVHLGDPKTLREVFLGELWRGQDNLKVSLRGPIVWSDLSGIVLPILSLGLVIVTVLGLVLAPVGGLVVTGLGCAGFAALSAVRAGFMLQRSRMLRLQHLPQVLAVAMTYDLGRALALVWKTGHHRSRKR